MRTDRKHRAFQWISTNIRTVVIATVLAALALGALAPFVADTDEPSFDPRGEVFDIMTMADETLRSATSIATATFLVEASDGGDVLTAAAFREWHQASQRVLNDPSHQAHLVTRFDTDLDSTVPGVLSLVDLVATTLPGGLERASDAEVKSAVSDLLDPGSPFAEFRFTLSEAATTLLDDSGTEIWQSPAFTTSIVYDLATFDEDIEAQLWLRDVQADLREDAEILELDRPSHRSRRRLRRGDPSVGSLHLPRRGADRDPRRHRPPFVLVGRDGCRRAWSHHARLQRHRVARRIEDGLTASRLCRADRHDQLRRGLLHPRIGQGS